MLSETTREVSALDACSALSDESLDEAVAAQLKPKVASAARATIARGAAKPKRRLAVVPAKPEWNDSVKPPSTLLERGRKNQQLRDFDIVEVGLPQRALALMRAAVSDTAAQPTAGACPLVVCPTLRVRRHTACRNTPSGSLASRYGGAQALGRRHEG
jgi:hypothetical protein